MIITITGAAGVGKTTIVREMMRREPRIQLVTSFTSRSRRDSDLPHEYCYEIKNEVFEFGQVGGDFLWVVHTHGNTYGTTKRSVDEAVKRTAPSLMILSPESVPFLRNYLEGKNVVSFYVLSPSEDELRRRLKERGDDAQTINRRVDDCRMWDKEARQAPIPYLFIKNEKAKRGIGEAAQQILKHVGVRV